MKKLLAVPFLLLATSQAQAAKMPFKLSVEPLVGYERVQKVLPERGTKDRMFYGARVVAGFLILAAEAEYIRGEDTEESGGVTFKDTDDKAKLGLRSGLGLGRLFQLTGRGGVQAKKNRHEETEDGDTEVTVSKVTYDPYAGASLRMALSRNLAVVGDVTAVFGEFPDMSKNEYQTSLAFSIRLP